MQNKKIAVLQVGADVFYAVPCTPFFSPYHKNTNQSKLNDSKCADFLALRNLDNYQEEVDPRTFHHLRWSSLWLWHKKIAGILKYTSTNVAGPLHLAVYNCKTEETLQIPWCIPYWFASLFRFKCQHIGQFLKMVLVE